MIKEMIEIKKAHMIKIRGYLINFGIFLFLEASIVPSRINSKTNSNINSTFLHLLSLGFLLL